MTGIVKTDQIQGAQGTTITIPTGNKISITDSATIGTVTATNIGGTLTTAAQSNVTSLGTLTGLTSTGRINVNFNGSGTQAFKYTDTGGGNLASFGQYYNTSDGLIANVQNANNDGIWVNIKNGGIVFDQVGYTAANALDDYEIGTFTATLEGSSSNPSSAVTLSSARYTKIGRQVMVQGQFSNVDTTGASGAPRVTGLPFAASTSFACGNVMTYVRFTIGGTARNISPYVSGTQISFYQSVSGGGWGEIAHSAGTGAYLAFTAVYDTNS